MVAARGFPAGGVVYGDMLLPIDMDMRIAPVANQGSLADMGIEAIIRRTKQGG